MGCQVSTNSTSENVESIPNSTRRGYVDTETKTHAVVGLNYTHRKDSVDIGRSTGLSDVVKTERPQKNVDDIRDGSYRNKDKTKKHDTLEVVAVKPGMQISLPSQTTRSNENEIPSPRKQIEDKTPSEKEKKKREEDRKRIFDQFISLKTKYKDMEIQFSTLKDAAKLMSKRQPAQQSSSQNIFSLDETNYKRNCSRVAKLQQDKARRLNRLCELASARLRHNNPAIADLSDQNRATKLAEKLSELYDNEWTDTFEAAKEKTKKDDQIIAESLRDILKFCNERCRDIVLDQQRTCFCLLNLNVETDFQTAPPELKLQLKELQKNISQNSLLSVKEVIKNNALQNLKENVVVKSLHSSGKKKPYDSYIDMCTEITWYMQLQDPPLVFDFDGSSGEVSRFRPYTVSGQQLDYILWPVLLLNEGGPVVSKGVAQFRKNSGDMDNGQTNKTEKKKNTDGNDLSLV